ncbi:hypothetical protein M8J76_001754 [Diaphorina citri]|nr:hypothetical protein M8J75_004498 [Diaphorina citri]KAI5721968.1 hypothetical protein M8J76_001754 [Diaphorina citri]
MLTSYEKEVVVDIIALLKPLEAMTRQSSGDKYSRLSQILPMIRCGEEKLKGVICKSMEGSALQEKIQSEYNKRFKGIEKNHLVAAATIMDPRFKQIHFVDPIACSTTITKLRAELKEGQPSSGPVISSSSSSASEGEETFDLWAHHKTVVHTKRRRSGEGTSTSVEKDELNYYLASPVQPLNQSQCPISAWDDMKSVYPNLYRLSRKYIHLIGTSVPSERLFSKAGTTATLKRNRLTSKRLSKLLFLNDILSTK